MTVDTSQPSDNPVHIKLYLGRQFKRILRELEPFDPDRYSGWRFRWCGSKRGHTFYGTRKVTVPRWTLKYGRDFALAYLLHEVAHLVGYSDHGDGFRDYEETLLSLYGLSIVRRPRSKNGYAEKIVRGLPKEENRANDRTTRLSAGLPRRKP